MNKSAIHKLLVLLLIIILPIFILKRHKILRDRSVFTSSERLDKSLGLKDKHFAIVIPSCNNLDKLEKSLKEIAKQTHENYEILFVDAKNRAEIEAIHFLITKDKPSNCTFFSSYYEAIHSLKNNDIVIHLETENWFADEKVLDKLAYIFSNPDTWLVYCSYMSVPSYKVKLEHARQVGNLMKGHTYKEEWLSSPIKIFYAGLFKELSFVVAKEDTSGIELKTFLKPMVQKAKKHIHYIPESLYYHDEKGPKKEELMIFLPLGGVT